MSWAKGDRKKYIITRWHVLELFLQREKQGKNTNYLNVGYYFRIPLGEAYQRIKQLDAWTWITTAEDRGWLVHNFSDDFKLSSKAKNFLEQLGIKSFLSPYNRYLVKTQERASKGVAQFKNKKRYLVKKDFLMKI